MLFTIIIFILILSLLVFVHELGHFLTAKKSGVKVEEFGFGFPPRLWGIKKGETVYSINWIPLGGFVKLKGEDGSERAATDSFSAQSFGKRGLILSAGVLMNVVLTFILLSIGFMIGLPSALSSEEASRPWVSEKKVQIVQVIKSSPAALSGLEPGDQLLTINGQTVLTDEQVIQTVKEAQGSAVQLTVKKRQGQSLSLTITPAEIKGYGQDKILGVNLAQTGLVKYGFFKSLTQGLAATIALLGKIILAFYDLLKNLLLGRGVSVDLSGPVGVAVMTSQVVDLGLRYVLQFAAMLSLNLAVVNFLPFPALDGGRFLFLIIEKIRRRPNNQKIENFIHNLGFSLLLLLIILITYRDVAQYGGGVLDKLKGWF